MANVLMSELDHSMLSIPVLHQSAEAEAWCGKDIPTRVAWFMVTLPSMTCDRLRESGKLVVGFGERKTPQAFVHSCDRFVFTEVLRKTHRSKSPKSSKADAPKKAPFPIKKEAVAIAEQAEAATAASATAASDGDSESEKETDSKMEIDEVLLSILGSAVEDATDEQTGWAHLSQVRALATRSMPELDSRNYGYKRFSDLVTATGLFQFQDPSKPMFVKYLGAPAVGYND
jgi:hypothetical protein